MSDEAECKRIEDAVLTAYPTIMVSSFFYIILVTGGASCAVRDYSNTLFITAFTCVNILKT